MKRFTILWGTALALGWLFDLLFWSREPGINFSVYVLLCLAGGALVLLLNGYKPSWKGLPLVALILFFAGMSFMRREPLSIFLSFAFSLFLMALLAQTWTGGRWAEFSLADHFVNSLKMLGSMAARPILFLVERRKEQAAAGAVAAPRPGRSKVWAVLRGLLIALPVVAIFAALLASADLIFASRLEGFMETFRLERLPEYIFRLVYILLGAYMLAGLFLHAAGKSGNENLVGEQKPLVGQFLGFTEAVIVLVAVDLLFLLFVFIQFRYFFGGEANINAAGYTYSEYARRGFGELVAVAVFSLLLLLGLSAVTRRSSAARRWVFTGLGIALVLLVGVMLFSALQRLALYEAAYGFSRLRMYTHVFIFWLAALLAVVVLLDVLRRLRFAALAVLLAAVGFAATLLLLNVDGFIVRRNVARAPAGSGLDVPYLASLSPDSVPALVSAFEQESLPAATRDAVGAALVCRESLRSGEEEGDWRSFTLSDWKAEQAIRSVQSQLTAYDVSDDDRFPVEVLTPMSVYYECTPTYGD